MRVNEWTGTVECSDCGMDLGAYPNDYGAGPADDVYCGHCENENHECAIPEPVAEFLRRAHDWDEGERAELAALALLEEMSAYVRRELTTSK
ncbi:hypothetical protein EF910_05530 [Streptomyces sp. WAC07149]|uniref:hypothetical protein n=1 Tax=Streptomyces sp. WAC07149 TaxID=2487425 RepID=UPI000F780DC6|nr:hypothetical protein [Streptomyces sp. WAC07149]RST07898.1 hypothetical protein EF910_05530 [Streptomyces sp. WAC07149]